MKTILAVLILSVLIIGCTQQTSIQPTTQVQNENSICNPLNGKTSGSDCSFIKDPAQVRFEETNECGTDLAYNCNGGKYSKYHNACVGKDYYDYSGKSVTLTTQLEGDKCVNSGASCSAKICKDDERCGGTKKASECGSTSSSNTCTASFATITNGQSAQCVTQNDEGEKVTFYFKNNQMYYEVNEDGTTKRIVFKPDGFYIQLDAKQKNKEGPFQGCDWMYFEGCAASPTSGFAAINPSTISQGHINCQPAEVDETKFITSGNACNWAEKIGGFLGNLPFN
ncbi:hypothetical protein HUU53_01785 [Candidatus Micrarchaeota archaeon]|nr:hypothetical protein [Candidatus Micrarchaeota archaeon]